MKTVQGIKENQCTGCKMCGNICPVNAITFQNNEEGFWYPHIDEDICIKCGLCEKKCPALHTIETKNHMEPKVYAGWSKNDEIRYKSTSGGIYYELAKAFIAEGGYISGCVYSEDYKGALHIIGNTEEHLLKIMGSKYFQSDTEGIYKKVKEHLETGHRVMFCGAPCQVAALVSFLGTGYDNLYVLEFICKGINSPFAFRAYMEELEEKYKSKIKSVRLKSKKTGWESLATEVHFENGKEYFKDRYTDWWIRGYTCGNLFMRQSCQKCNYKQIPRIADITFGDFWGIKGCDEEEHNKGISVILSNSSKGDELLELASDSLYMEKRELDEVYEGNPYFLGQAKQHENRKKFFEKLQKKPFTQAVKESYVELPLEKVKRYIKLILKVVFKRKKW